jgi:uncharacterized protein (TIGR03382 family)
MRTSQVNRLRPAAAVALLAGALIAQPAAAGIFSAVADARLGYSLGSGALPSISYDHTPTVGLSDSAVGAATLTLGSNDFVLASSVGGNGEIGASSTESALVVTIENLTGAAVELIWELTFNLGAASAYALAGESAYAEAFISLFTDGDLIAGSADLNELIEADADVDGAPPARGDRLSFTLALADGDSVQIDLTVGTFGTATGTEVQVPAPPLPALLGLGLGLLGWRRRCRAG